MSKELASDDKLRMKRLKPEVDTQATEKQQPNPLDHNAAGVLNLQQKVGNQAVQRLLAQRSGDGAFDLDEETSGRINQARGSGSALDSNLQRQMGQSMGYDLSGVRVHTSSESDELNHQLNAKAFTTGQDIFFKQGEYNPGSSGGQELIAHELTHVVQQGSGKVGGSGSGMTVNPPGDTYEQEADSVAKQVTQTKPSETTEAGAVQREEAPEMEDEELQMKADDTVQREEAPEMEDEELQMKADDTVQREEAPEMEDEELQMKADDTVQREEAPEMEDEELQMKEDDAAQPEEAPELEEEQEEAVQRQETNELEEEEGA